MATQECETATIELADVDQLKLDPRYRSHKLNWVIARTAFTYTPRRGRRDRRGYPVYLVAGYLKQPRQFEAGLPDFTAFLQHIEIGGQHGFEIPAPTAPVAVSRAAVPPFAQAAEAPPVVAPAPTPAASPASP